MGARRPSNSAAAGGAAAGGMVSISRTSSALVASYENQEKQPLFSVLFASGVWRFFPCMLLYSVGFATLFPVIPTLVTNGFASQAAGHYVDCQQFTPATSPPYCRDAHRQAVMWTSWTSFASGTVLSFVCAPVVGRLSDHFGRKPFMMAGVSLALLPMLVLMVFCWGWVPIELYYPMSALNGMVSSFSMALTSIADRLHQAHRATAIGYLSACFSIGILVGPLLGGYIDTQAAVYVCVSLIVATLLYTLLFIEETAPRVVAARALRSPNSATAAALNAAAAALTKARSSSAPPNPNPNASPYDGIATAAGTLTEPLLSAAAAAAAQEGVYQPPSPHQAPAVPHNPKPAASPFAAQSRATTAAATAAPPSITKPPAKGRCNCPPGCACKSGGAGGCCGAPATAAAAGGKGGCCGGGGGASGGVWTAGGPSGQARMGALETTGLLDFDPIPNIVPHAHEHTLTLLQQQGGGGGGCCGGGARAAGVGGGGDDDEDEPLVCCCPPRGDGTPCYCVVRTGQHCSSAVEQQSLILSLSQQQLQQQQTGSLPRHSPKPSGASASSASQATLGRPSVSGDRAAAAATADGQSPNAGLGAGEGAAVVVSVLGGDEKKPADDAVAACCCSGGANGGAGCGCGCGAPPPLLLTSSAVREARRRDARGGWRRWACCCLPSSSSEAGAGGSKAGSHAADLLAGWAAILRSPYYCKVVVIMVIVAMTWEGAQDMLMQYLQLQLGFNTRDQAHLLMVVAALGLLIKLLLLPHLVRVLGEQWLLVLGLSSYMLQDLALIVAPTKALALVAVGVGAFSCVSWPASVALQTRHVDPCDMGAVQGALSGASSLATGLGPIGFAFLFSAFSRTDSTLPYFPQVVWYLAAAMSLVAIALTATLHLDEKRERLLVARTAALVKSKTTHEGGGNGNGDAAGSAAAPAPPKEEGAQRRMAAAGASSDLTAPLLREEV